MSGYKSGDTFTITGAATKTREGWLYYQVTDDNNSAVTGWVFAGGLTAPTTQPSTPTTPTTTPTKDNSIQIVYLNAGGQQVGQTYNWIIQNSDLKSGAKLTNGAKLGDILTNPAALTDAANKNVPSGYTISKSQPNNPVANVTVGSNYTVYVDQKVQSYTSQLSYYDSDSGQPISSSSLVEGIYPVFNDTDKAVFTSSTQGQLPASVFDNNVFKTGNLATLTGNAVNIGGKLLTPTWNFDATKTKQANANAKYGDTVKLYYKANPLS
ncbi:hypothetical protein JCM14108_3154 [Lentilactobacillus farraginis DSM 18382 = JCM 14108]|nr:hypothetical protein JCM14108_3154 [Lentilactobacillus farraginis DSM 18382 = JCM 14108]